VCVCVCVCVSCVCVCLVCVCVCVSCVCVLCVCLVCVVDCTKEKRSDTLETFQIGEQGPVVCLRLMEPLNQLSIFVR
jgi:hypothetical protein